MNGSVMKARWSAALLALLFGGCSPIQLVSHYDEDIDRDAQQLQRKLDEHFVSLQNADAESLRFRNQQKFYESVLVDMNALGVRAGAIYRNQKTVEQIDLAKQNLAYLVLLNKNCVSAPLTDEQKRNVKDNGIDLSMHCKVENGATADAMNRGEATLNRFVIPPVQAMFNQQLGAVMALELAKKRGAD